MLLNQKTRCPVCGEYFEFEYDLKIGDTTYCVTCDEELKVVRLNPPKTKRLSEIDADHYEDIDDHDDYIEEDEEEEDDIFKHGS